LITESGNEAKIGKVLKIFVEPARVPAFHEEKAHDRSRAFVCRMAGCVGWQPTLLDVDYFSWTMSWARFVLMPSGVCLPAGVVDAFGNGVPPLTGEPLGDGLAIGAVLGVGEGGGTVTGLFAFVLFAGVPLHAPRKAVVAARIKANINDLLIVLLLECYG
jgi:hypothetical protein